MNKATIALLTVLLINHINATYDDNVATNLRQHFIGETFEKQNEHNFDSENSTYEHDQIQEEYEDTGEKYKRDFMILQKRAPLFGLSGICLVIGIVILLNKFLYS